MPGAQSFGTARLARRLTPSPTGPAVRRPTGAPPPLPHPVSISTRTWPAGVAMGLAGAFLAAQHTPWLRMDDRVSTWALLPWPGYGRDG